MCHWLSALALAAQLADEELAHVAEMHLASADAQHAASLARDVATTIVLYDIHNDPR
ncbi:MAG: hypothetical protein WC732_09080 [Candidatus Omnitrophota bacterium]